MDFNFNQNCFIENCEKCSNNSKECLKCKENFSLLNNKCYLTKCSVYGECKYCTEYDCVLCYNGYSVLYGVCEKNLERIKFEILLYIIIILLFIIIIFMFLLYKKKSKKKYKAINADILNEIKPKNGQYMIINTMNLNNNGYIQFDNSSKNLIEENKNSFNILNTNSLTKPNTNSCVICNKTEIYSIRKCGCVLCKEHTFDKANLEGNLLCPIHQISLNKGIVFQKVKNKLKKMNSNEEASNLPSYKEKYKICYICKVNKGKCSFNCGCPVLLCNECFNDNIYVFKINRCPGCNKPYKSY